MEKTNVNKLALYQISNIEEVIVPDLADRTGHVLLGTVLLAHGLTWHENA